MADRKTTRAIQSWLLRRVQHITTHVNTLDLHFTLSHDKRFAACVCSWPLQKTVLQASGHTQGMVQDISTRQSPVVDPPRRSSTIDTTKGIPGGGDATPVVYNANTVQSWPTEDRDQILAVAGRDLTVARRNLAELTRYVDIHAAHLATCTGGSDNSIPLMAAETYPRLCGCHISIKGPVRRVKTVILAISVPDDSQGPRDSFY